MGCLMSIFVYEVLHGLFLVCEKDSDGAGGGEGSRSSSQGVRIDGHTIPLGPLTLRSLQLAFPI